MGRVRELTPHSHHRREMQQNYGPRGAAPHSPSHTPTMPGGHHSSPLGKKDPTSSLLCATAPANRGNPPQLTQITAKSQKRTSKNTHGVDGRWVSVTRCNVSGLCVRGVHRLTYWHTLRVHCGCVPPGMDSVLPCTAQSADPSAVVAEFLAIMQHTQHRLCAL